MTQIIPIQTETETETEQVSNSPLALSEVHGKEISNLDQSLWDIFSATVSAHPDREALVSVWQPAAPNQSVATPDPTARSESSECLRWTYRNLQARAEQLASFLEGQGCGPGMHLAAILWNCAEWGLLFWAAAKIGMTFVPIDPRATDDIPFMLESTRPRVLVVQDADTAAAVQSQVDSLGGCTLRLHCSGEATTDGWMSLSRLLASDSFPQMKLISGAAGAGGPSRANGSDGNTPALIIFTSGTMGKPKACPHTNRNLAAQTSQYDANADREKIDRWLVHTPVFHIFAVNNAVRAWRLGDAVVFAAKSFSVDATAKALVHERCTIMSATPTLVKALLSHSEISSPQGLNLSLVTIAGTMIGPEDIRLCREGLGARDAIQAYGLSEGAPLISWSRGDSMLVDGWHAGVGKVLPGISLRICRPGTTEVLPRAETGELHVSGPPVISGYMGGVDDESFYTEGSVNWFKTGDRAIIDEKGVVHIMGRYKDLIIRGGENINPLTIETALNEFPGAQVVGVSDDIAGQVPVAIIKVLPEDISKKQLAERARQLGSHYALDGVYTLEELGLDTLPTTSLGKPKKTVLAGLVIKLRSTNNNQPAAPERQTEAQRQLQIEEKLLDIWDQITGVRPDRTDSVLYLADSITLLRYCDAILRSCGRQIYLQDIQRGATVEELAKLLAARDSGHHNSGDVIGFSGPSLGRRDFNASSQAWGNDSDKDLLEVAQERANTLGLPDGNIEHVIPIRHSLHRTILGERPQSYHVRIIFRVKDTPEAQILQGLSKALDSRPMLRTLLFHTSQDRAYHAVIPASEALLRELIWRVDVDTEEDAKKLYEGTSTRLHPGELMFKAVIISVKQTGHCMLVMTYNHSVIDALTLLPWHRDLDQLIHDPSATLPSQTPYQLFADLFSQYQESAPAQKSVSFHVKRLRGISRCKKALWPKQRAPGMMIADDQGSPYAAERQLSREKLWNNEWEARASEFRFPRRSRVVQVATLPKLQEAHGVEPSMFFKCALTLFNVLQTRSQVALFNSWEGGRSWPFVPKWIEDSLPPAMSIDGPTFQWILNMVEVHDDEPLTAFFERMKLEQEQVHNHVHAPWEKVVHELREEGEVAVNASFRQSFVWDVSMGLAASKSFRKDFETLEPVSRFDWADSGFFWNAFMVDKANLFFIASWDTAQMGVDEVDDHCDSLADVLRKIADENNWNKTVGEIFSASR
ncbi:Acyl-CoA ligase sidI-like protein [Cladobotryum mycophilum]|uniref:Acyl-CoA ligase sidI-like protein n=1 Tax=Cladobotryum mycophilum TaxID=491253 RepID=A0ABR0ST41_9HYPO